MAENQELPKVRFVRSGEDVASSPTGAPLLVSKWIKVLGIEKIARELTMEKHHGLEIEHLLLLILLYSSYGVNSIKKLKERALKDKAIEDIIGFIDRINEKAIYYFQGKYSQATLQEFIEKAMDKPQILEGEGLYIRTKTVFLKEYEELDFILVSDGLGNEMGTYVHLKGHLRDRNMKIIEHLSTQEPKDSNKMKIGLELIKRAKKQCKIKAENVAFDSWYFVTWFVSELLMITGITRVVSKLKTDQMVMYKEKSCRIDSLWDSVKFSRRNFNNTQTQIRIGSLIVEIENLGKVKAVFVQELDTCFRIKAEYILVTTDVNLSNIKTLNIYKSRWSIETFYRTAKQRFGLESFHCLKFASIFCHVTFVFLSYLMLANIKISNSKLSHMTFGEIIDQYLCCVVSVKKIKNLLIAYLSPEFVDSFGLP